MSKKDLVQSLVDYFELSMDGECSVTDENLNERLASYDFISGASLGYGGPWLSLGEVVKALDCLCDER